MKPEVQQAVVEIRSAFPKASVEASDLEGGGAFVSITPLDPGPVYEQPEVCLMFEVTNAYPTADIYPMFAFPKLTRSDGQPLGGGFGDKDYKGNPCTMISRRQKSNVSEYPSAGRKVKRVWAWVKRQ